MTPDERRPVRKMSFMASQGKATQGKVNSREDGPKCVLDGQGELAKVLVKGISSGNKNLNCDNIP